MQIHDAQCTQFARDHSDCSIRKITIIIIIIIIIIVIILILMKKMTTRLTNRSLLVTASIRWCTLPETRRSDFTIAYSDPLYGACTHDITLYNSIIG